MTGPDTKSVMGMKHRPEERQADDVIVVRMGQEDIGVEQPLAGQLTAQRAQPSAGIENQQLLTAPHFQAGSVSAITPMLFSRAGDRTPDAPKAQIKVSGRVQTDTNPMPTLVI